MPFEILPLCLQHTAYQAKMSSSKRVSSEQHFDKVGYFLMSLTVPSRRKRSHTASTVSQHGRDVNRQRNHGVQYRRGCALTASLKQESKSQHRKCKIVTSTVLDINLINNTYKVGIQTWVSVFQQVFKYCTITFQPESNNHQVHFADSHSGVILV